MRHHNAGRKFDRNTSSRRAMFRNMTANLILHERIETTDAKAKELRRVAERLITKARRLATKRLIAAYIPRWGTRTEVGGELKKVDLVEKVLLDLAKRFKDRPGGYTRIIKFGPRRGDNAPVALIELVGDAAEAEKPAKKSNAKKAEAATAG